jgi:2-methylaconitate cis-trans-isomerase PrpF
MAPHPASIPFTLYRGGTSKALFLHSAHLPPPGPLRDRLILRLYGSPDPLQIDGMGGSHPVTSKVAVMSPSERDGVDVDYLFGQVSIKEAKVSWDGGCGNISAAVGPWAVREGLVKGKKGEMRDGERRREVRIWMVGTGTVLVASVPVGQEGEVRERGETRIDGCPGMGAGIWMDYKETGGGAVKRGLLPTGRVVDEVRLRGRTVEVTVCDIAHIIVFGRAGDFGIRGDEDAGTLNAKRELIDDVREFRGRAAEMVGLCSSWERVDEEAPNLPYVVLLSEGPDGDGDVQARLFLDNHCHTSMAGAGATCTAACSRIEGTLVNQIARKPRKGQEEFRVQHPLGHLPISIKQKAGGESGQLPEFETLSFVRTARRLAKGELFVPEDFDWDDGGLTNGHE